MIQAVVLGCDPGMTTGFCLLVPGQEPVAYSCSANAAYGLAVHLIESNAGPSRVIAAGEKFVPGRGAGARQEGARVTRDVISDLDDLLCWHWRSASQVKTWATDKRLEAAGLYGLTAKMKDARDSARHALYCAVHDAGMPDPLSREGAGFWAGPLAWERG